MKVIKCSLVILLFPFLILAGNDGEQVKKKISRDFNIRSNGRVELYNKNGNMDIAIGESNQVRIDVNISVSAGNKKKAEETLNRINIAFEEGNNRLRAITEIESNSGWTNWINSGNVDIEIHYEVLVPADVFLELSNKYGDIYLETTNRDIMIDVAFGSIRLGDINGKLDLKMEYSEGSMSLINDGNLKLAFSELEMEDGRNITMDLKYSDIKSGTCIGLSLESGYSNLQAISVGDFKYTGKYDDISLDQVKNINASTSLSDITIHELNGEGSFDMRYGDLVIEDISRHFSKLDINTSYTGVELNFKPDANFSIDAEMNYCGIHHNGLKVTENVEKPTSRTFKATRGNGGGRINVRMNYGELVIE